MGLESSKFIPNTVLSARH